jgi:hypothetical protein
VPTPLYLLEFVAGTMKRDYEQTPQGSIAHEEDSHQRRQIVYEDGARLTVHVQGSQVVGLPTQFDKDYLFGLFRLAAEGRVRADGSFVDPSYREILRATGRPEHAGKLKFDAVKRALARFASLVITTNAELDYGATAAAVGAGTAVPATPEGRPGRRTLEAKHWVLEYEVLTETRAGGQERDLIGRLRLNPMWLDHVTAASRRGWTWRRTTRSRRSGRSASTRCSRVRAARGWRAQTPHVVSLERFLDELGVTTTRERGKVAENLRRALALLEQAGVVAEWEIARAGAGRYEVTIYAGDRLLAAGLLRGVDPHSPVGAQVLLAHLARTACRWSRVASSSPAAPRTCARCSPSRTTSRPSGRGSTARAGSRTGTPGSSAPSRTARTSSRTRPSPPGWSVRSRRRSRASPRRRAPRRWRAARAHAARPRAPRERRAHAAPRRGRREVPLALREPTTRGRARSRASATRSRRRSTGRT